MVSVASAEKSECVSAGRVGQSVSECDRWGGGGDGEGLRGGPVGWGRGGIEGRVGGGGDGEGFWGGPVGWGRGGIEGRVGGGGDGEGLRGGPVGVGTGRD